MEDKFTDPRQEMVSIARYLIESGRAVFLDTETTGVGRVDEVIEIAVVGLDGVPLLDTLVKPRRRKISRPAMDIHGITNEMVADAPTFDQVLPRLEDVLADRYVVVYNAEFDLRLLDQSAHAVGLEMPALKAWCAMVIYAQFHGEWNDWRASYQWQTLERAIEQMGLGYPIAGIPAHRAWGDAEMTRRLVFAMAGGDGSSE